MKRLQHLLSILVCCGLFAACSGDPQTQESTTTTLSPAQIRAQAPELLEEVRKSVDRTSTWSDAIDVDGELFAWSALPNSREVQVWSFEDGAWGRHSSLTLTSGSAFSSINGFDVLDVTDDGADDLVVSYWNIFDAAEVFVKNVNSWVGMGEITLPNLGPTERSGQEVYCLPDCNNPIRVKFNLQWTGLGFARNYVDAAGNSVTISDPAECADYIETDFAPLGKCNSGDAVIIFQAALQEAGFLMAGSSGQPVADGYFGPSTALSVRLYQYAKGFPVNGIADGQWYYDLVDSFRERNAGNLPNFGVAQACEDALGSVKPLSNGNYYYSDLLRTLQNCNRSDWLDEVEKWRSDESSHSDAWYEGGVDGLGHYVLLDYESAREKLNFFCSSVRNYYRYSIDLGTLLACD